MLAPLMPGAARATDPSEDDYIFNIVKEVPKVRSA